MTKDLLHRLRVFQEILRPGCAEPQDDMLAVLRPSVLRISGWHPHLDSIIRAHYDASVRTTVTLDDDVVRGLRALARRREQSFKQVLNDSLRLSFSLLRAPRRRVAPFRVRPHRSAFRPGIDVEKLNQLVDELEAEHRLRKVTART